jgi:hypothetical protein
MVSKTAKHGDMFLFQTEGDAVEKEKSGLPMFPVLGFLIFRNTWYSRRWFVLWLQYFKEYIAFTIMNTFQ